MKKNAGFTLIELLITIFLVSVGLIGVIAFFNSSLTSQFDAKNELIAAGLAQEATELVRNFVDYNYLNNTDWYSKFAILKNIATNANARICLDYYSLTSRSTCAATSTNVCLNDNKRYYQCASTDSNKTEFSRTITLNGYENNGASGIDLDAGDCLKVVAAVTWTDKATTSTDIICEPRQ